MKIFLPVDGSPYTKRMLGYVAAHDEMFGPGHDYVIVTVVAPIPSHVTRHLTREAIDHYYLTEAEDVLQPVRAFAKQNGWNIRASHLVGQAAESIAAMIDKEQPDLIVMGSHGYGAFAGLILGSVATGVLARCQVPVLLVR